MATAASQDYEQLGLLIDGVWETAGDAGGEDVLNPATGDPLGTLPHAGAADLDRALAASVKGFDAWRKVDPPARAKILKRAADLIRQHAPRLARICTLEQGKPLGQSMWEIMFTADRVEWLGEEAKRHTGELLPPDHHGAQRAIVYEPVGPVLGMSPWNLPVMMPISKLAHALAAGCSIILKPSEETPASAIAIVRLFEEAGVPAGVINVVFGVPSEVSSRLIASPSIRLVSFTGSVSVGKHLYRLCADTMKKLALELGGHAPVIVFDDVDVDRVVAATAAAKFSNAGQNCIAPTRFYVHERIADSFTDRFVAAAEQIRIGNGLEQGVEMGPMANARRIDAMEAVVADAQSHGATLRTGGRRIGNEGFFWSPTVLSDVPDDAHAMREEPFGPVALINRWRDTDEVVRQANALPYGLAAYAFTGSQRRAMEMGSALEAGMVSVNVPHVGGIEVPFGGVKDSGVGRENGVEGLKEYLVSKVVTLSSA